MKNSENFKFKKNFKRMGIFFAISFLPALIICYILERIGVNQILNGMVIIVIFAIFYLIFYQICARIDNKRKEKLEKHKSKDPFSE